VDGGKDQRGEAEKEPIINGGEPIGDPVRGREKLGRQTGTSRDGRGLRGEGRGIFAGGIEGTGVEREDDRITHGRRK